jgi:hypothetical protein
MKQVNDDLNSVNIDDDDVDHLPTWPRTIVHGISCQGYNAVMHSIRGDSSQHHDAQLGMITGALSGSWAKGRSSQTAFGRLQNRCSRQLPHASFAEKIENDNILRDLRLENVYYIDVEAMQEAHQVGS